MKGLMNCKEKLWSFPHYSCRDFDKITIAESGDFQVKQDSRERDSISFLLGLKTAMQQSLS